jgi:hypothetical protein
MIPKLPLSEEYRKLQLHEISCNSHSSSYIQVPYISRYRRKSHRNNKLKMHQVFYVTFCFVFSLTRSENNIYLEFKYRYTFHANCVKEELVNFF